MTDRTRFADRHIDKITRTLRVIEEPHAHVHEGERYILTDKSIVNDGNNREIYILTPSGGTLSHFVFDIKSIYETEVKFFEESTRTYVAGNALTPINRNRTSLNTSGLTICHTPVSGANGTLLLNEHWGVDSAPGKQGGGIGGEGTGGRDEFILKPSTVYLIKVISGTNSNRISIILDWYEHESFNEY